MLFMTIPTAGARQELLSALIQDCGLPLDHIVIVATKPNVELPDGVVVLEDFDTANIQRWWASGIEEAQRRGATAVAVLNDDIRVGHGSLASLHEALMSTGAAIASPSRPPFKNGVHRRPLAPYEPRLWGSLWVVRVDSGLRPDPRYVWWYGDNDLDIRARRDHGGVVLCDVEYEHLHPSEGTSSNPALVAQTDIDAQTFEAQYARLLRLSRLIRRWQSRFGQRGGKHHAGI